SRHTAAAKQDTPQFEAVFCVTGIGVPRFRKELAGLGLVKASAPNPQVVVNLDERKLLQQGAKRGLGAGKVTLVVSRQPEKKIALAGQRIGIRNAPQPVGGGVVVVGFKISFAQ